MRSHLPVVALVLTFALACGGSWNQAQARAWAELTVELDAVADGPNRTRVAEILDEAYVRTAENEIGFSELGDFKPAFEDAIEDGTLDDQELAKLEAVSSAWSTPPAGLPPERRATRKSLLLDKRETESKVRKKAAKKALVSFAQWEMPEDLRARLTAAGVEVSACDSDVYDDLRSTECEGTVGPDFVEAGVEEFGSTSDARAELADVRDVTAARRDGRHLLVIHYVSQAQSKALSEAILAENPPQSLSIKDIKKGGQELGFRKKTMECSESIEDGESDIDCNFDKDGSNAYIWLNVESGVKPGGEVLSEFDREAWEVEARGVDLDTTVYMRDPAVALMDAMFTPAGE